MKATERPSGLDEPPVFRHWLERGTGGLSLCARSRDSPAILCVTRAFCASEARARNVPSMEGTRIGDFGGHAAMAIFGIALVGGLAAAVISTSS